MTFEVGLPPRYRAVRPLGQGGFGDVMLVRASDGFPFAPKAQSARVAALRDAVVVELPGGHHLHLDTPEPVAAAIRELLAPLVAAH